MIKRKLHHERPQKIQERWTRPVGGIDYGAEGRIIAELVRNHMIIARLIWFKGSHSPAAGVRGFGRDYSPANLTITGSDGLCMSSLLTGGKLTKTRLMEVADKIEKEMGKGVVENIDLKATLIITEA